MLCLITDLLDWEDYPAIELARLYKWRWDGSETALREAKAPLHGAGPGTGAMLRSGSPLLIAQEIAAWAVSTEMTRGVTRGAARVAVPARKGRRAGQPVRLPRPVPDQGAPPHPRRDPLRGDRLPGADQGNQQVPERLRPEPAPLPQVQVPQHVPARRAEGHGHPDRAGRHHPREHARLTSGNTGTAVPEYPRPREAPSRPVEASPSPARHAGHRHAPKPGTTQRNRKQNRPSGPKPRKPASLRRSRRRSRDRRTGSGRRRRWRCSSAAAVAITPSRSLMPVSMACGRRWTGRCKLTRWCRRRPGSRGR